MEERKQLIAVISKEFLHRILNLPIEVKIVDIKTQEWSFDLLLESEKFDPIQPGEQIPNDQVITMEESQIKCISIGKYKF